MGQSSCWGLRIRFVEPRFSGIQWNKDFLGSLKLILDEFALNLLDFGDDLQNNAERCEHQQNDSQ